MISTTPRKNQMDKSFFDSKKSQDILMKEAERYPVLTQEEHQALAVGGKDKPKEAIDKLVKHNIKIAVKIAYSYNRPRVRMDDIVAEAILGMHEAAIRYEPLGFTFPTYAAWWVKAYINNYINKNSQSVNMPAQAREGTRILKRVGALLGKSPLEVTDDDIKQHADTATFGSCVNSAIASGRAALRGDARLNDPIAEDSHVEKQDLLAYEDPELTGIIDAYSMDKAVAVAMGCLDDRERLIINLRFFSEPTLHLVEVGDKLGLSRERIRQIQDSAFKKMRKRHGDIMASALGRD